MGRRGGPVLPYRPIAGVVPCGKGWLVCGGRLQGINLYPQDPELLEGFEAVLDYRPAFEIIALGAPVGLDATFTPGGRTCDREARLVLGPRRSAAIVSPPSRAMVAAWKQAREVGGHGPGGQPVRTEQSQTGRSHAGRARAPAPAGIGATGPIDADLGAALAGLSGAGRSLLPRVAEIDASIAPYWQRTVFEVRAELTYHQLNGDTPLQRPKGMHAGRDERAALLVDRFPGIEQVINASIRGVRPHHLLDGAACLWAARRIAARAISRLPVDPEWDELGLRTEIVR